MSLPSSNNNIKTGQQSSIRSFFTPKQPTYAPPPPSRQTAPPPPPPPATATAKTSPPPPAIPSPHETNNGPSSSEAALPRPASLHPQATISPILPEHIPALRRITSLLLPVNYPDSFWARLSDPQSSGAFSRVLLWTDDSSPSSEPKVIGGLVCRPEPSPFPLTAHPPPTPAGGAGGENSLYIQSLVLLSPYRGLGLAAALLADVARAAARSPDWACAVVWAHVWTDNADGLRWYLARGFEREPGAIAGYYFKLRPDSAWIVRRRIDASGGGGWADANGGGSKSNGNGSTGVATAGATASIPPSTTAAAANLPPPPLTATPPVLAATSTGPPPPRRGPSPSPAGGSGMSFQNARPETEWNDLPADMHVSRSSNSLAVPGGGDSSGGGGGGSGASSRSSSGGRKKKDRAYPAAAFGK
ncbi:hypothetical protein SLS62_001406 [Diatrype stigma]|uniref:N-acetyltransferase domain-containing protein n=1 Tax=Diatrype stigma TaxID=117547 RepID=A0AAN9V8L9_9PEZI